MQSLTCMIDNAAVTRRALFRAATNFTGLHNAAQLYRAHELDDPVPFYVYIGSKFIDTAHAYKSTILLLLLHWVPW